LNIDYSTPYKSCLKKGCHSKIMKDKTKKNEEKYPASKAYGKSDKYTKL